MRFLVNFIKSSLEPKQVIVVSGSKIREYEICRLRHMLMLSLIIGVFVSAAYFVGNYFALNSELSSTRQNIHEVNLQNHRLANQFELLKKDIANLGVKQSKLSEYSRLILDQYSSDVNQTSSWDNVSLSSSDGEMYGSDHSKAHSISASVSENYLQAVFKRTNFLEESLYNLIDDNQRQESLIQNVNKYSSMKNKELGKALRKAGLKLHLLRKKPPLQAIKRFLDDNQNITNGNPSIKEISLLDSDAGNQGGPYQPLELNDLDKIDKEFVKSVERLILHDNILSAIPTDKPFKHNFYMSSSYGNRIDPFTKKGAFHSGLDFVNRRKGAKVLVTNHGVIRKIGKRRNYGNYIEVDHGFGLSTKYGHLGGILVKKGDIVRKGQAIATQGNTGRSTGDHLHYEVRFNDRTINPYRLFKLGKYVRK